MSDPNFPPPPGGTPPPPPPPGGGFGAPPPPPGGTPPPPGGYGGGTPPPPGGYGGPPAQPYGGGQERPQLDVGSALSYGWKKFSENTGAFIILMIAVFVASIAMSVVQNILTPSEGGLGSLMVSLVLAGVTYVVTSIVQAGVWRAGLGVTRGTKPSVDQLFETENIVPYILTNILVAIGMVIGLVLCILPGIAWLIFTSFAGLIALEKGCSPVEAITESINWVKDNFGQVFVILLVSYIVYVIGACLCGVGLLVSAPVALVAITYTYRALNNEMVAP